MTFALGFPLNARVTTLSPGTGPARRFIMRNRAKKLARLVEAWRHLTVSSRRVGTRGVIDNSRHRCYKSSPFVARERLLSASLHALSPRLLNLALLGLPCAFAQSPPGLAGLPGGSLPVPSDAPAGPAQHGSEPVVLVVGRETKPRGMDLVLGLPTGVRFFGELGPREDHAPEMEGFLGLYLICPTAGIGLRWPFRPLCGQRHALVLRPGVDGYILLNPFYRGDGWLGDSNPLLALVAADVRGNRVATLLFKSLCRGMRGQGRRRHRFLGQYRLPPHRGPLCWSSILSIRTGFPNGLARTRRSLFAWRSGCGATFSADDVGMNWITTGAASILFSRFGWREAVSLRQAKVTEVICH